MKVKKENLSLYPASLSYTLRFCVNRSHNFMRYNKKPALYGREHPTLFSSNLHPQTLTDCSLRFTA